MQFTSRDQPHLFKRTFIIPSSRHFRFLCIGAICCLGSLNGLSAIANENPFGIPEPEHPDKD